MEPLLRYAGSKRRIADLIISYMKDSVNDQGRYVELFAGGAAVFFRLEPKKAVLVDICKPIISFYEAIQREPALVNDELDKLSRLPHSKDTYYKIRSEWNYHDFGPKFAARLLYLNKTGYNGLFRLNKRLEYNVPWGDKSNPPRYPSPDVIAKASSLLSNVSLHACDYGQILANTRQSDYCYADPPYWNMYDGYSGEGFTNQNHRELAEGLHKALERGVSVYHSNIECDDVRALYQNWAHIHIIPIKHTIAAKSKNRRTVNEVLVAAKAPYEDPRQTRLV